MIIDKPSREEATAAGSTPTPEFAVPDPVVLNAYDEKTIQLNQELEAFKGSLSAQISLVNRIFTTPETKQYYSIGKFIIVKVSVIHRDELDESIPPEAVIDISQDVLNDYKVLTKVSNQTLL